MADHWLVRTSTNVISGPYARDEVIALIRAQRIGIQDEICVSDGLWFGLHENEEIAQQLGIGASELNLAGPTSRKSVSVDDNDEVTKVVQSTSTSRAAPPTHAPYLQSAHADVGDQTSHISFSAPPVAASAPVPALTPRPAPEPADDSSDEVAGDPIGRHEIGHPATLPSQTDGDTLVARRLRQKKRAGEMDQVSWIAREKLWRGVTAVLIFVGFFVLFVIIKKLRH